MKKVEEHNMIARYTSWITRYIIEEGFSEQHLIALYHIVGLFNHCAEAEKEIFDFADALCDKYKNKGELNK